ncbi:MAG: DUF1552 domain-containing protein [Sandaracinaceae bacterium]
MTKSRGLARRTFLRGAFASGAAVTIGLPLFEAMTNAHGTALADGETLPRRFVLWFWANGVQWGPRNGGGIEPRWAPSAFGSGWNPADQNGHLRGLGDVKDYVSLVSRTILPINFSCGQDWMLTPDSGRFGCDHDLARNPHAEGACGLLTGTNAYISPSFTGQSDDWNYMSAGGPSIDEVMADTLGATRFRSLLTAVTQPGGVPGGIGTLDRYVSHSGPRAPNELEVSPRRLFDRVFGGGAPMPGAPSGPTPEERARASVLDVVLEDARKLEIRLGPADRALLEGHMDRIRELERQLGGTGGGAGTGEACETPAAFDDAAVLRERHQQLAELITLAFACDLTRVAVVQYSSPGSQTGYGVRDRLTRDGRVMTFHDYEHIVGYDDNTFAVHQYLIDAMGDFIRTMRDTPEAGGNILDQSAVLGTSEVSGGQYHTTYDMPLIVAGKAGGGLTYPGIHLDGARRNTSEIMLTLLSALGGRQESWGSDQFRVTEQLGIRA